MSRRRSTSSSHIQFNHDPGVNDQNDQNIRSTSELYKQAYQSLMYNECYPDNASQNTTPALQHSIPPPHRNNLKPINSPVNSPLRRPHSPSEDDLSELEDFEHDFDTKMISNNRKKTKMNNNNNNNNIEHNNSNRSHVTSTVDQSNLVQQQQLNTIISTTTNSNLTTIITNQQANINSSIIDKLTDKAKLFAQTRYPFPLFTLRFSTPHIHEQKITDELCKILKENKQLELQLCGYRKASTKCLPNECDLLLFVKNSYSFSILLDDKNWPQSILGLTYTRPSTPSIPPQLSLIVKNVSLSIDFVNFTNEIKATYSNVRNFIRMKTKIKRILN